MTFAASVQNNRVSLDNDDVQRVVDTCCLGCVFAQGTFTQTDKKLRFVQKPNGCDMNVLTKMTTMGQEMQDSIDKEGNEFQVIRGRVCPYHRTPQWSGWSKQDTDTAMIQARNEVRVQPDVVIYLDNSMDPNAVLETTDALDQGKIRPKRVYVINNSDLRPSQVMKLMSKCTLPWRTETVANGPLSEERAMDIITAKCTSIFVTFFVAGYKPPLDFFVPIDIALHDDLDRFILLSPLPNSMNGMTVLRNFYRQVGGMSQDHIVNKAKRISEKQKCQYLVRPVTEVVTQLSR